MRKKRVTVKTGITESEFQEALAVYASSDAGICKINADLDVKITDLRKKVEDQLTDLTGKRDESLETIKNYSVENKDQLFSKKKSMETSHGTIGFRTGTPKLDKLKGFTWNAVTNMLKEFLPAYVRTVEEPAKDKLLADRDKEDVATLFTKVGVCVKQDETFFIELKKESVEQ